MHKLNEKIEPHVNPKEFNQYASSTRSVFSRDYVRLPSEPRRPQQTHTRERYLLMHAYQYHVSKQGLGWSAAVTDREVVSSCIFRKDTLLSSLHLLIYLLISIPNARSGHICKLGLV